MLPTLIIEVPVTCVVNIDLAGRRISLNAICRVVFSQEWLVHESSLQTGLPSTEVTDNHDTSPVHRLRPFCTCPLICQDVLWAQMLQLYRDIWGYQKQKYTAVFYQSL